MKATTGYVIAFALAVCAAWAEDKKTETGAVAPQPPRKQTLCPVMGGTINTNLYADVEGMRIYFCCPACVEQFKKDPDRYLNKLKQAGIMLEKTPPAETGTKKGS